MGGDDRARAAYRAAYRAAAPVRFDLREPRGSPESRSVSRAAREDSLLGGAGSDFTGRALGGDGHERAVRGSPSTTHGAFQTAGLLKARHDPREHI